MRQERGLFETYEDPERADVVFESRRGFLNGAGRTAMALAVGAHIPFGRFMPEGLMPAALAQRSSPDPAARQGSGSPQRTSARGGSTHP